MERNPEFEVMRSDDDPTAIGIREQGQDVAIVFYTGVDAGEILYRAMVGTLLRMGAGVTFFDDLDKEYFNGHE